MKAKFLCRYPKAISENKIRQIEEEIRSDSIMFDINEHEEKNRRIQKIQKFAYAEITFDLSLIDVYTYYDLKHTHVFLRNGQNYILKINPDIFEEIYSRLTGQLIENLTNIKIEKIIDENEE